MSELTTAQNGILTLFTTSADKLENIISQLLEKDLNHSMGPGEWTIRQIIHHVPDDGDAWSMAFKKALATPGAYIRFEGFPGNNAWAEALGFDKRSIPSAMSLIKSHRKIISE